MPLVLAVHSVPSVSANVPFAVILLQVCARGRNEPGGSVKARKESTSKSKVRKRAATSLLLPLHDPHSGRDCAEADARGPTLQAGTFSLELAAARWLLAWP